MSVKLKLDGVATLAETLRGLPLELRDGALPIVGAEVDRAEEEIRAAYPIGPTKKVNGRMVPGGNLRAGLRQDRSGGGLNFGARVVLKNTAKHAFLFEAGSEFRHPDPAWVRRTRRGGSRGRMPAGKVFIPAVIRARARMVTALIAYVEKAGFHVRAQ